MMSFTKTKKSAKQNKFSDSDGKLGSDKSTPKPKLVIAATSTIKAKYVVGLQRVTKDKDVWLLTGITGEKVIVKIEGGSGTETPSQFRGRVEAVNYLAKTVLPRAPKSYRLDVKELDQLILIAEQHQDENLKSSLAKLSETRGKKGATKDITTPVDAIVKMEYIDMGDNLLDRVNTPPVSNSQWANQAQELLLEPNADEIWRDMGRLAAFDLVVINSDRFASDGYVGLENIDFSAGNAPQLVPLDNVDKKASVETYSSDFSNDIFKKTGDLHPALYASLADNTEVLKYSKTVVKNISKDIRTPINVATDQPPPQVVDFMAGFLLGKRQLWELVHSNKPLAIEKGAAAKETMLHWQWLRARMENIGAESS